MKKNKTLLLSLLAILGISGCTWDDTAFTTLYKPDGNGGYKETYSGVVCGDPREVARTNDDTPIMVDRCTTSEYCLDGKCVNAGEECTCAVKAAHDPDKFARCVDLIGFDEYGIPIDVKSNGFGRCLPGSQCIEEDNANNPEMINYTCKEASVSCTSENYKTVCGVGAKCEGGLCKCGDLDCGGRENTCCLGLGCFDFQNDINHCGACESSPETPDKGKCASGMVCAGGVCAVSCLASQVYCGGKCIDPLTNLSYCGAKDDCTGDNAGDSCASGMVCAGGVCAASCLAGQVYCGGKCIDPTSDRFYCGAQDTCEGENAGNTCPSGMVCAGGVCAASCLAGQVYCGGKCIDPTSDRSYCGASLGGNCDDPSEGANYRGKECPTGNVCAGGKCSASCLAGQVYCGGKCIDPTTDRHYCGASGECTGKDAGTSCDSGMVCSNSTCAASCLQGQVYCGGKCIDPMNDRNYCGASGECDFTHAGKSCDSGMVCANGICSASCLAGQVYCGGKCIDPKTDPNYCGATGDCSEINAGITCASGMVCTGGTCSASCLKGQVLCGGKCVDPNTDRAFCGAKENCDGNNAGKPCPQSNVCIDGVCTASCLEEQVLCGNRCVDPKTDRDFCGAEGNCDENNNGEACKPGQICSQGRCSLSCQEGLEICGDVCVNKKTDKDNCGSCGNKCKENAQICVDSQCVCPAGFTLCPSEGCVDLAATHRSSCSECIDNNWGDCDKIKSNGCEVNLLADNNNCGKCTETCPGGQMCSNGSCATTCGGELTKCKVAGIDGCYNLNNDALHCGSCTNACSAQSNATATCTAGGCLYTCNEGYANCGTPKSPDCKNLYTNDATNCGACGRNCSSLPNVLAVNCTSGVCQVQTCQEGFGNCDEASSNGCEVEFSNTKRQTCTSCLKDYENCDGNWDNGCEINISADNLNCGSCHNTCPAGQVCSDGTCKDSCPEGQDKCGNSCLTLEPLHLTSCSKCVTNYCDDDNNKQNGCEVQVGTSVKHCSACNVGCASKTNATALCTNGICQYICNQNYTYCGTATEPKCVNITGSDKDNCGYCGHSCSDLPNVTDAICNTGKCTVATCKDNFANCDGNNNNGCETNANESLVYCGASGDYGGCFAPEKCDLGEVCVSGECGANCAPSQVLCNEACINPNESNAYCGANEYCLGYTPCTERQKCIQGHCQEIAPLCPEYLVVCDNRCIDPENNPEFCGAKENCLGAERCVSGITTAAYCAGGECHALACAGNNVVCQGKCVNPLDPKNCGPSCTVCTEGESCLYDAETQTYSCALP